MDEVIEFEKLLANITVPKEEQRNPKHSYTKKKIEQIKNYMPLVKWEKLIIEAAPEEARARLSPSTEVVLMEPEYLKRLAKLLNETEPRLIVNFVLTHYAAKFISQSGERYEDALLVRVTKKNVQEFSKVNSGKEARAERWKECTQRTMSKMPYAVGALYVRNHFNEVLFMVGKVFRVPKPSL